MRRFLIVALVGLVSVPSLAHRDTVLSIGADGLLEGLPTEYSPAFLRIAFSSAASEEPPILSLELSVSGKTVTLPICVTGLVFTRSIKDVRVKASWYHKNGSPLPHYVSVTLYDPGHERARYRPGYSLLFDLSTAKLIGMEVNIVRDAGTSVQMVPVDLSRRCSPSELESFADESLRSNYALERTREK